MPGTLQNLCDELQQQQLTIQQLTQQVQALTSLRRSRSTSDQPASDSVDSTEVSHATDIQVDTFPGLEAKTSPETADSTGENSAVSKGKPTIRTVDLGDEVGPTLSACSQEHVDVQQPAICTIYCPYSLFAPPAQDCCCHARKPERLQLPLRLQTLCPSFIQWQ